MNVYRLDKNAVLDAAKKIFPDMHIELDEIDLYLPDIESGEIKIKPIEESFYVSTNYVYEDRIVNGNKTRYKVPLSIIYTKRNKYEVIYDSKNICYVAYEEDGEIKFCLYIDFYDKIKNQIKKVE